MREYSTPPSMEPPTSGNLTDDVVTNAREAGDQVVFSTRPTAGSAEWTGITAASSWTTSGPWPRGSSPRASSPATGSP